MPREQPAEAGRRLRRSACWMTNSDCGGDKAAWRRRSNTSRPAASAGSTKTASRAASSARRRRRRRTMSRWMWMISGRAARGQGFAAPADARPGRVVWRQLDAGAGLGRGRRRAARSATVRARSSGATSSSTVARWNGSIPALRSKSRTASKSDVAGRCRAFAPRGGPCATGARSAPRRGSRRSRHRCRRAVGGHRRLSVCGGREAARSPKAVIAAGRHAGAARPGRSGGACRSPRRMRNRVALGGVVIKPFRFFQGVEHVKLAVAQHGGRPAELLQRRGLVRHDDHGRILAAGRAGCCRPCG